MFKTRNIYFLIFLISSIGFSQNNTPPFKEGEFLKFKINYGLLNAGFASLEVNTFIKDQDTLFHANGKGWTTGMTDFFFPVNDNYQTYFYQKRTIPYHFIRILNEGGYKKNKEIFFDFNEQQAKVLNHKHNTEKSYFIEKDVQDMLSSLYYLRELNFDSLVDGDVITIKMFFDQETYKLNVRLVKRNVIKTKFGKVKTLVLKPMVQGGRVFKDKENVTIWLTDDKNKIPIKIKAAILIGSIKAELIEYKGLANSFPIIFN